MENKSKYPIWAWIGGLTVGTASIYGLYRLLKGESKESITELKTSQTASLLPINTTIFNQFPLQWGSKGTLIKTLQQALMAKYGRDILPKWHDDGVWGKETNAALSSKGHPTRIENRPAYNTLLEKLTKGTVSEATDYSQLGESLWKATLYNKFEQVKKLLAQLHTTQDYAQTSIAFKKYRLGGVTKTLVTGLFDQFTVPSERSHIHNEFIRIGLKYDGSKWSLSGLGRLMMPKIKTTTTTQIWDDNNTTITVPNATLLGKEIQTRAGITMFENTKGKILYVNRHHVRYV